MAAEPSEATAVVPGDGKTAIIAFGLTAPADAHPGRVVVTADVDIDDEPRGELAETLLEVVA
jgi:hypothetical protein